MMSSCTWYVNSFSKNQVNTFSSTLLPRSAQMGGAVMGLPGSRGSAGAAVVGGMSMHGLGGAAQRRSAVSLQVFLKEDAPFSEHLGK